MHSSTSDPPAGGTGPASGAVARPSDQQLLTTLFDLGRQVTAVLDLDELLQRIPQLISRLTDYQAFSVYLLDERRAELSVAYAVGYPEDPGHRVRMKVGEGLIGIAAANGQSVLVDDVLLDP